MRERATSAAKSRHDGPHPAPLGEWFRGWIAPPTDIAESTHALYEQVLATWIDAPIPLTTTPGRPRALHLGIRTLASLTPAVVRE